MSIETKPTDHPLETNANWLAEWAESDSCLSLPRAKLRELLASDVEATGTELMTDAECMAMICGGEDGEVPRALIERFPATHAWLEEQWA